jgi:hypothetical protein
MRAMTYVRGNRLDRFAANAVPTVNDRDWSPVMHQTSVGLAGYRQ